MMDPITIPAIAPPESPVGLGKHRSSPVLNCENATVIANVSYVGEANVAKHAGVDVETEETSTAFTF